MDEHDPVNHPAHYTQGGIECIDAIEAAMTFEEFVGFLRGQMIKYVWRAGNKDDAREDIEKALWYGDRLRGLLRAAEPPEGQARAYFGTWLDLSDMAETARKAEARDREAVAAKERELAKLSHLEDTDGNVVLMYTDHVNWDEAPEWANFLAYDGPQLPSGQDIRQAYWFETRPEWLPARGYWRSGGQGGKLQHAEPYSGEGGDPRLFVRAAG